MSLTKDSALLEELEAVASEFDYARERFGSTFDEFNTINDYIAYATGYMGDAAKINVQNDPAAQRRLMIKAANLLLTAAHDIRVDAINPRFYDEDQSRVPEGYAHGEGRAFG